jgi:hypothetical protein
MESNWSETVILVDADYVDSVAFQLTVNFERMLGRRIPKADLAQWLVCVALDGGLRPAAECNTNANASAVGRCSVVLTYTKGTMQNFTPGELSSQIHGQAFMDDQLGEFTLSAYPVESIVGNTQFFLDVLDTICAQPEVKRLIVVPNTEQEGLYDMVRQCLRRHDTPDRQVTLLTMQPMTGGTFRQEILGYSLMAALGIRADEVTSSIPE